MTLFLALAAGFFIAYANGANDNFKGVATLFGSHATTYRKALIWATLATVLGSLAALLFYQGLIAAFSGKGLVLNTLVELRVFPLAIVAYPALSALSRALSVKEETYARRVAETLSTQLTPMNEGQGFTANVVAAMVVLFASSLEFQCRRSMSPAARFSGSVRSLVRRTCEQLLAFSPLGSPLCRLPPV